VKKTLFPFKEGYSKVKHRIVLGQMTWLKRQANACLLAIKKFRRLAKNSHLSPSRRKYFARKCSIKRDEYLMLTTTNGYAKSGGGRNNEFQSFKEVGIAAMTISKALMRGKTRNEAINETVALLVKKYPNITRCYIPKVGEINGQRPLGVPPHFTKMIEYVLSKALDFKLAEVLSSKASEGIKLFGFKQGDACWMPMKEVEKLYLDERYNCVVALDQSGAYDAAINLLRDMLIREYMPELAEACISMCSRPVTAKTGMRIDTNKQGLEFCSSYHDENYEYYLKKFAKVKDVKHSVWQRNIKGFGTPQGGVISPKVFIIIQFAVYKALRDKWGESIQIVGYADDGVIFCDSNIAEEVKSDYETFSKELGLLVNSGKTHIISHESNLGVNFLGWNISEEGWCVDTEMLMSRLSYKASRLILELFNDVIGKRGFSESHKLQKKAVKMMQVRMAVVLEDCDRMESNGKTALQNWQVELGKFRYTVSPLPELLKLVTIKGHEAKLGRVKVNPFADKLAIEHPMQRMGTKPRYVTIDSGDLHIDELHKQLSSNDQTIIFLANNSAVAPMSKEEIEDMFDLSFAVYS